MNMILLVVNVVFISMACISCVVHYFSNKTIDRVPKFRRNLMKKFNEYGIKNELKDEMLYIVKKGWNIEVQFTNGYDGIVHVAMDTIINLEDFDIDPVGEMVVERRINDGITWGKARFVQKKTLSVRHSVSVHNVDNIPKLTDHYVDVINSVCEDLYANKEQLEARFSEKAEEQKNRKIGF